MSGLSGGGTATVTIQFDAAGAVTFDIFLKEPGSNDFVPHAGAIPDHQYVFTDVAGSPWQVYVVGKNAVGDGPPSATVSFSGPVQGAHQSRRRRKDRSRSATAPASRCD